MKTNLNRWDRSRQNVQRNLLLRLSDRMMAQRGADIANHRVAIAYPWNLFTLLVNCAASKHGALAGAGENLHAVLNAARDRQDAGSNVVCMRTTVWLHTRLVVAALSRATLAMNQRDRRDEPGFAESIDRCVNDIGCVLAQLASGCDQQTRQFAFVSELFESMGFTLQREMDTYKHGR